MKAYFVTEKLGSSSFINQFPQVDCRPVLIIANSLSDVAKAYPNAHEIKEADVKEVHIVKDLVVKE